MRENHHQGGTTTMALSLHHHHHRHHHHHTLLLILPFLLLSSTSTSAASHHHDEGLKSLHFALYQHETINKTGYIIVNGVAGPGVSQTTGPFGTLLAFDDPMTLTPNMMTSNSKIVAITQGTAVTTSLDGLDNILISKITLDLKHYKGSISIVGVGNNIKPSNLPVVGGTGDFLFVQGYVTSSPVNLVGITLVYKVEFHLFWPPYATRS